MSNLNEQDIAEILEEQEVRYSTDLTIGELLKEWEDLIEELSEKEIGLIYLKEYYESESHKMETTVDFKELYGKNNADIRKHHIKTELADVVDQMTLLKLHHRYYVPLLVPIIYSTLLMILKLLKN